LEKVQVSVHQSLLWLPDALRDAGINFAEMHGWKTNQPGYYWTNEDSRHFGYNGDPVGWVWHHTASLGYTPYVKNANGQTKANLWMGLARGNRLYQEGNGPPTTVITSGGPANYSEGSGKRVVLTDYVAEDRHFPGPQSFSDDYPKFWGNRHYGTTELVHAGNGSPCHAGVWEMQLQVAALLSDHYGWSEFRHIGHLDHSKRKIDQKFQQGQPYTIAAMQTGVASLLHTTEDDDDMMILAAIQDQTMKWYESLQDQTNHPGGNASYWGKDYVPPAGQSGPTAGEWDNAKQEIFTAALEAGVFHPPGQQGEQGEQGDKGDVGTKGDQGPRGQKGDPGPQPVSSTFSY
jgi:hypothetical protein